MSCFGCQFVPAASPLGIRAFGGRGNIAETTRDGAQLDHSVPGRGVGGIAETTTFEDCACFGWYPLLAFRWKYASKVTIIVGNSKNYHFFNHAFDQGREYYRGFCGIFPTLVKNLNIRNVIMLFLECIRNDNSRYWIIFVFSFFLSMKK